MQATYIYIYKKKTVHDIFLLGVISKKAVINAN